MFYFFPDTNVFIHGKHFEDLQWHDLIGDSDIKMIIAPIVIKELDKLKYNSNAKIAKRVKALLPKLLSLVEGRETTKVNIQVLLKQPPDSVYSSYQLDRVEQDDQLLASILDFKNNIEPNGGSVVLITNDVGAMLKSKALQIDAKIFPEDWLRAVDIDENQKAVVDLQRELQQYRDRTPKLRMCFPDLTAVHTITRPAPLASRATYVKGKMDEVKSEYREWHVDRSPIIKIGNIVIPQIPALLPTEHQVADYNQQLSKFILDSEVYFNAEYELLVFEKDCVELSVIIKNDGFVPAEDIDIVFNFLQNVAILEDASFPTVPLKPQPPKKPSGPAFLFSPNDFVGKLRIPGFHEHDLPLDFNQSGPRIEQENEHQVLFSVRKVKHNQSVELEPLTVRIDEIDKVGGFTVEYQIFAANVPTAVKGQLHLKFA